MPRATPSLLTQLDCENADANIKDGRPAARLLTLGGGPCLQITPGKLQADGRYALSKYWLFSYSLEGHAHRIGLGSCDKLPLDRARVEALLLQKQVENGIDPLEQRHEQRKERWIQNIIVYAVAKEYRTDGVNPAVWRHGLQPLLAKPSKVRRVVHHPAMRYAQVPAFMAELAKDSSTAARALTFTVLTGLRSPVRYAVWGEIDWKMKTKEDFECPLSDAAVAILKAIKGDDEPAPNAPIFTGRFGDRLAEGGFRCVLQRVCKEMGIKAPTVHGFRSSFRDFAGDKTNHRRDVAEAALAHTVGGTEGAYRRETALEKRRRLMQHWADYLSPKGGNIIPLKRTA